MFVLCSYLFLFLRALLFNVTPLVGIKHLELLVASDVVSVYVQQCRNKQCFNHIPGTCVRIDERCDLFRVSGTFTTQSAKTTGTRG